MMQRNSSAWNFCVTWIGTWSDPCLQISWTCPETYQVNMCGIWDKKHGSNAKTIFNFFGAVKTLKRKC